MSSNNPTPAFMRHSGSSPGGVTSWLWRWGVTVLGVLLAAFTSFGGIGFASVGSLLVAAIAISFLNVFLRPILVLLALPFVMLTLGFGLLLINAVLFKLTAWLVDGFVVNSWWAAIWGGFVVSFVSFVAGARGSAIRVYGPGGQGIPPQGGAPGRRRNSKDDDVIDV